MEKRTRHSYLPLVKTLNRDRGESEAGSAHPENMMPAVPKGSVTLFCIYLKIQMLKIQIIFSEESHCYSL